MTDDYGATVREWVDLVRRARLGRTTKAVAYAIAQYADGDGTRIFPGIYRLSVECELAPNSVKASLVALRTADLLQIVRKGTSRGRADEYRLIIGPAVLERIEVLSPNEVTVAIEKLAKQYRGVYRPKPTPPDLQHSGDTADPDDSPVDNSDLQHAARAADDQSPEPPAARGTYAENGPAARGAFDLRHAGRAPTNHVPTTTTTNHKNADLDVTVTVPNAQDSDQDPISEEGSTPPNGGGRHRAPQPEAKIIQLFGGAAAS